MRRSPVNQTYSDEARRRRLPAKWLAAVLITAAVGLLAPGMTYITAGRSSTTTATATAATTAATATALNTATAGCQGVTPALLPASGFITNPNRAQGGHLWWRRSADGSVCIGTVIMWVQYNATATKTWQVTIYSARHPAGLIVASRTFSLKRGWYWWGFGVHQNYQGLEAVCVSATESFGMSCVNIG